MGGGFQGESELVAPHVFLKDDVFLHASRRVAVFYIGVGAERLGIDEYVVLSRLLPHKPRHVVRLLCVGYRHDDAAVQADALGAVLRIFHLDTVGGVCIGIALEQGTEKPLGNNGGINELGWAVLVDGLDRRREQGSLSRAVLVFR